MRLILPLILTSLLHAAIPPGAIWSIKTGSTASNVNGAFFNPGNANFPTDGTVDTNTGNTSTPVFSSASYNFVAGDVGAWLYVKSGTNTYPGWYQIASVASNKATLTAASGSGVWHNSTSRTYTTSTSDGIASVGTPTSITWGIDYSQGTTATKNGITDLASSNGTSNPCDVTSAGSAFGINHIGNGMKITAGTNWTATWYEIVNVTGSTATLDKACGSAASISSGTFYVGGSLPLGSSDDAVFEMGVAGNDFLISNATYTIGGTVSIAAAGGSQAPIRIIGYNSLRSDKPTGSTRPIINAGANTFTYAANWDNYYIQGTGSAATAFALGSGGKTLWSKFTNTSTTAARNALQASADSLVAFCELISYRGYAINLGGTNAVLIANYIHDSDVGVRDNVAANTAHLQNNLIIGNVTAGVQTTAAVTSQVSLIGNTIYGAANKLGKCVDFATGTTDVRLINNIISGCTTGVYHADAQTVGTDMYNAYYNNTADTNNWALGVGSITGTNPSFTSVTQLTHTGTVTSSTNVLTDTGADFSGVTDNVDFVTITGGSGTGFTTGKYLITSHTGTTLTLSSNLTSSGSGSSITYEVTLGKNFAVGGSMAGLGIPGVFPAALTTGYMDIGAVQRSASGGGTRIY